MVAYLASRIKNVDDLLCRQYLLPMYTQDDYSLYILRAGIIQLREGSQEYLLGFPASAPVIDTISCVKK